MDAASKNSGQESKQIPEEKMPQQRTSRQSQTCLERKAMILGILSHCPLDLLSCIPQTSVEESLKPLATLKSKQS